MRPLLFIFSLLQLSLLLYSAEKNGGPSLGIEYVAFLVMLALPTLVLATFLYQVPKPAPETAPESSTKPIS